MEERVSFVPELVDLICPPLTPVQQTTEEQAKAAFYSAESGKDSPTDKKKARHFDLMNICLVIEFVETDLDSLLKHQLDFTESHLIKLLYNTLCSLSFLHMCNIMHRDLKPANILIRSNCSVRICDFGLSRTLPETCSNRGQTTASATNSRFTRFKNSLYLRQEARDKYNGKVASPDMVQRYIQNFLENDRDRRRTMQRTMSLHVGSRWYRAPEISLVEKQYD